MNALQRVFAFGVVLVITANTGYAQSLSNFFARLSLRESVFDKNTIEKPAYVQMQFPQGEKATYAAHAGLTLTLVDAPRWFLGPTLELHRNNQSKEPQATFVGGLTLINVLGDVATFQLYTQGSLEYKQDKIKRTAAGHLPLRITPVSPPAFIGQARGPAALRVMWQPTAGVDFEHVAKSKSSQPTGTALRFFSQVEVAFYPADGRLQKRLELTGSYSYWHDVAEARRRDDTDDGHQLIKSSANIYFDSDRHFAVGFDYVNGENPTKSQPDQTYKIVAFRVRY